MSSDLVFSFDAGSVALSECQVEGLRLGNAEMRHEFSYAIRDSKLPAGGSGNHLRGPEPLCDFSYAGRCPPMTKMRAAFAPKGRPMGTYSCGMHFPREGGQGRSNKPSGGQGCGADKMRGVK